jgi:hypothetical protein
MSFFHRIVPAGSERQIDTLLKGFFEEAIKNNCSEVFFLVTAGLNDQGIPWCPDCRTANPLVASKV